MIPKIIHYCWFGGKEKPEQVQAYIDDWKEQLPNYTFMEWNESNVDISHSIAYVQEAYEAGKYAFVSDYVRVDALCKYGGVYFDTDIELIKDFSAMLPEADVLLCYESKQMLCTAFMASAAEHALFASFRASYHDRHFKKKDGTLDTTTINRALTDHLSAAGIKMEERNHREDGNIAIYTSDYFSAQDLDHGHPYITENTYTVHRFNASWANKKRGLAKVKAVMKYKVLRPMLQKILGYEKADRLMDRAKK